MAETLTSGAPTRPDGTVVRTRSIGNVDGALNFTNDLHRSGPEVTRDPRRGKERDIQRTPEQKKLDETRADFKKLLTGDLNTLIQEHQERGERGFNEWAIDAGKGHYLKLFQELTTNRDFEGAKGDMRHIDMDRVDKLLADNRGLARVYDIMRIEYADMLMSEGLKGYMKKDAPRAGVMDARSITMTPGAWGTELGRNLMDFFSKPVGGIAADERGNPGRFARIFTDKMGKVTLTLAGASAGAAGITTVALGTAAALTPPGLALVVGAAAAPEVYAAIQVSFRKGATYNKEVSLGALRSTQRDAAKVKWMKSMHGVDPMDFQRAPGARNKIRVNPRRSARTTLPKEIRRERSDALMNSIFKFQEANRIPRKYIEPMDVLWILRGDRNPPQQGDRMQARIMAEVDRLGGLDADVYTNLARYRQVQEQFLTRDLDFVFRTILHRDRDRRAEDENVIRNRREALKHDPTVERRVNVAKNQLTVATENRAVLSEATDAFKGYTDSIKATRKELDTLTTSLGKAEARVANRTATGVAKAIPLPGGATIASASAEQVILNALGPRSFVSVTIGSETIHSLETQERTLSSKKEREYNAFSKRLAESQKKLKNPPDNTEQLKAKWAEINERHRVEQERITRQKKMLTDLLTEIQTTRQEIEEKEEALTSTTLPDGQPSPRAKTAEITGSMSRALGRVESWTVPPPGGIDLSRGELANPANSYDVLSQRIVSTGRLTAEEMTYPENRKLLLQAMGEARARTVIDAPLARLTDVVNTWGIPEATLLNNTETDATIEGWITAIAGPGTMSEAEVRDLRNSLRTRRDFETVTNPDSFGLSYVDALAMSPDEMRNRLPLGALRLADVTDPAIFAIPEADLVNDAVTDAAIEAAILAKIAGGVAAAPIAIGEIQELRRVFKISRNLDAVKSEASRHLQSRQRAADDLGTSIQAQVDQRQAEVTDLETNGVATPELDVAEHLNTADNYNRINEDIRNRELYGRDAQGRRNYNSIEELLTPGQVDAMDLTALQRRYTPYEVGQERAYVNLMQVMLQHRNAASTFTFRGENGEQGAFLRNREVITPDIFMRALSSHFTLNAVGTAIPVADWNQTVMALRYRMGLTLIPSPDPLAPPGTMVRSPIDISQDDLAEFLSEGMYNIMMNRAPSADAPVPA